MKSAFILFFILILLSLQAKAQQTFNSLNVKELAISKSLNVSSITDASKPCPAMTEAQRDATTPSVGQCVYNTDSLTLNVYNGSLWKSAGGGIENWVTGFNYAINDIVIESNKIYQANTAHTSTVFASDIANWTQIANNVSDASGVLPMANGGTDKALTPELGGVVYTDSGSMEVLPAGSSGQFLKSNGAASPSWADNTITAKSQNGTAQTLSEIQVPNNQLTETDTNKHLIDNCGAPDNIFSNCGFEHSTYSTGWTLTGTATFSAETTNPLQGKKSLKIEATAQTFDIVQSSTLYQATLTNRENCFLAVKIQSNHTGAVTLTPQVAGVDQSSLSVTALTDNIPRVVPIPFICGAVSNGIHIVGASGTGTTYVDKGQLELKDLRQSGASCNSIECETSYTAVLDGVTCAIISQNINSWITSTFDSGTGDCQISYTTLGLTVSPSFQATAEWSGGVRTASVITGASITTARFSSQTAGSTLSDPIKYYVTVAKQGVDYSNAKRLGNNTTYSSQNADTDWASCTFASLAWQGFGTVTNNLLCKRQGSDLLMRGRVVVGTVAASVGQIPLPTWGGTSLVTKTLTGATLIDHVGLIKRSNGVASSGKDFVILSPSASSVLNISYAEVSPAVNPFTAQNGSALMANSETMSIDARITINGWENSNQIIASFKEVMTVPGVSKPVNFAIRSTAICTTGTCATENFGSIATTATFNSTGVYTVNVPAGTCAAGGFPWCTLGGFKDNGGAASYSYACKPHPKSDGNVGVRCHTPAGAAVNEMFAIDCKCSAP